MFAADHSADPNILIPAMLTSIPVILGAITVAWVQIRSARKTDRAVLAAHDEVRTNHGKRAGEYLEMIGPLVEWAEIHTVEANETRAAMNLPPMTGPVIPEVAE